MKIVFLLLVLFAVLWWLRSSGRRARKAEENTPPSPAPRPMLVCAQCGVHLPADEALPGQGGVFCGLAHRADFEQAHPGA
jgi:uncharacterized protein